MSKKQLPTIENFKTEAKELRKNTPEIKSYSQALNALSIEYGYKSWKILRPLIADPRERLIKKYGLVNLSVDRVDLECPPEDMLPGLSNFEFPKLYTFEVYSGDSFFLGTILCAEVSLSRTYQLGSPLSWSDLRGFRRTLYGIKDNCREEIEDDTEVEDILSSSNADYMFSHLKEDKFYPNICVVLDVTPENFSDLDEDRQEDEFYEEMNEIRMLLQETILSYEREDMIYDPHMIECLKSDSPECFLFPATHISDNKRMKKSFSRNKRFKTKELSNFSGGEAGGGFTLIRSKNFRPNLGVDIYKEFPLTKEEGKSYERALSLYEEYFEDFNIKAEEFYLKEYTHDNGFFTDNSMILSIVRAVKNNKNPLIDSMSRLAEEDATPVDMYSFYKADITVLKRAFLAAHIIMTHDTEKSKYLFTIAEELEKEEKLLSDIVAVSVYSLLARIDRLYLNRETNDNGVSLKPYTSAYIKTYQTEEDIENNKFKIFRTNGLFDKTGKDYLAEDIVKNDDAISSFYRDDKSPFLLEIWAEDEERVGLEILVYSKKRDTEGYNIVNNRADLDYRYIRYT